MRVSVVAYESSWVEAFERIKDGLIKILESVPAISIEHVGSTAIPNLAAKPIIDVDIIIEPEYLHDASAALSSNGYTFNPEPPGIDRMSFRYDAHTHDSGATRPTEDGDIRRAVYLNVPTGVALRNHLAVRSVLLKAPRLVQQYSELKMQLATKEFNHISDYGSAKTDFLMRILLKSDLVQGELDQILAFNTK